MYGSFYLVVAAITIFNVGLLYFAFDLGDDAEDSSGAGNMSTETANEDTVSATDDDLLDEEASSSETTESVSPAQAEVEDASTSVDTSSNSSTPAPSETNGDDFIEGTEQADSLSGGLGNDEIEGLLGSDFLFGEEGDDTLEGGPGDDLLFGGPDSDRLESGSGDDTLEGGEGDDLLISTTGSNRLDGGLGDDTLAADNGEIIRQAEEAARSGDFYLDLIGTGVPLVDPDGPDTLIGGEGNDVLYFGPGASGAGGPGNDIFEINLNSVRVAEDDLPVIEDFDPTEDRIRIRSFFSGADFNSGPPTITVAPDGDDALILFDNAPVVRVVDGAGSVTPDIIFWDPFALA